MATVKKKAAASKTDQIPRLAHKKKTMNLKTELSQVELTAAAEELAESTQNVNRLEDQKKAATAQFKSDIDYASARRNKFAGIVATKCEYRNVDCDMLYDYEGKMSRSPASTPGKRSRSGRCSRTNCNSRCRWRSNGLPKALHQDAEEHVRACRSGVVLA